MIEMAELIKYTLKDSTPEPTKQQLQKFLSLPPQQRFGIDRHHLSHYLSLCREFLESWQV